MHEHVPSRGDHWVAVPCETLIFLTVVIDTQSTCHETRIDSQRIRRPLRTRPDHDNMGNVCKRDIKIQ